MSERDFETDGKKFKLNKIDAIRQFHIVRRIGPILSELAPALKGMAGVRKSFEAMSEEEKFDQIATMMSPIMMGLSKLSDTDADRVLYGLLNSVEMQQAQGNWARVSTDSSLLLQDLELPLLMQVAGRAFMYNLAGFFNAHQRAS